MALNLDSIGRTVGPFEHTYGWTDVALYAAALGAGPRELPFLLEPSPRVLPTWSVIPAFKPVFAAIELSGLDVTRLLHTAQRNEQLVPLPASGTLHTSATILGIYDMRIGALLQIESRTESAGTLHARTVWSLLVAGVGEFPSPRPPGSLRTKPPRDATPSFEQSWTTQPNQALLYRLTGDINPIHASPEAAQAAGLERPILHGLCTYGFAARVALSALCDNEPARFRSLEARFSKPVLPGQTLTARGYLLEPGKAAITVHVADAPAQPGELVIANALFEFQE